MGRIADAWARLTRGARGERGVVEAGVAAAGAVLVVGALVGNGVASTVIDMSDGQTWLPDEDGRIVQINPATGQPERRLVVGGPGSELDVAQRDGHLVVTDLATGTVTSIDLASLIASGSRGLDGEDTKVLLGGGMVVVVDLSPGTVRAVDPLTLADLGRPYRTDDLADAVIDDTGEVWLVTTEGQLRSVTFDARGGTWGVGTDRPVTGAGQQTRLLPHDAGATVFAPDGGVVVQVGNGADTAVSVAALEGSVLPAPTSPADLAPASVPEAGLVVMLADREALTVAVSEIGCRRPGAPQVFNDLVYVPCPGDGRVVVLDRTGARAAEDIIVPGGGDPELVVDDGRLIVRTPTDGRIVIVQADGTTSTVDISAADVPVQDATRPAPVRPGAGGGFSPSPAGPGSPAAPPGSSESREETSGPDGRPSREPTEGTAPRDDDPRPPGARPSDPGAPPGPGNDPSDPQTDPADPGDPAGPGDPGDPGDPDGTGDPDGPPTDGPGDPSDRVPGQVRAQLQADTSVLVTWAQPVEQPEAFVVATSEGSAVTVPGTEASATLTGLTCGRDLTVRVEAQYASGEPGVGTAAVTTADCAQPTPPDPAPAGVSARLEGDGSVSVTWTAPEQRPASYTVAASDGSRVSARGGETSATLTGLACERTLTVTVTALHADGTEGAASDTVRTADCPRNPAPSDVTAQLQGEDVRVSWTPPRDAPASYTVAASDGTAVTAGGGASSAVLADLTCGRTLTVTVTAHHAGGTDGAASAQVTTADCPAGPDPATPAGGVSASAQPDGSVRVTWTGASSGADRYVVRPLGGGGTTADGSARDVVLTGLTPGAPYRFEVETQLGSTTAVSAASNEVTVANVPGTVSGLSASVVDRTGSQVRVAVSFSGAPANGSPVTGYRVEHSGGGTSGSTTTGGTSTTLTVACSGQALCTTGGQLTVSVQATSQVGNGAAVSTTVSVPAPPPPPPANGDAVLSGVYSGTPGLHDSAIPMYVDVLAHPSWTGYTGTCRIDVSGAQNGSWTVPCRAGQVYVGALEQFQSITVRMTAVEAGVSSAAVSGEAPPRNQWAQCDLTTGICTDPVSVPGDPPVEIVPAPWVPPQVPNPPVLVAGLLLVGAAGTLRSLRRALTTPTFADSSLVAQSSPTAPENRNETTP
ncbi:hypothetical protein AA0Y32_09855 [Georgenia phoenicis]|uniref:fibronectin type III domain-containing protein n=1 Tax=unclassified Georgenia TaxID=2626815 RepID=UPI0039AEF6FB